MFGPSRSSLSVEIIDGCNCSKIRGRLWAVPTHIRMDRFGQVPVCPVRRPPKIAISEFYFQKHDSLLLVDIARREHEQGTRVVVGNEHWLAIVPFWAVWLFETLLLPNRPVTRLPELSFRNPLPLLDGLARRSNGPSLGHSLATACPFL